MWRPIALNFAACSEMREAPNHVCCCRFMFLAKSHCLGKRYHIVVGGHSVAACQCLETILFLQDQCRLPKNPTAKSTSDGN